MSLDHKKVSEKVSEPNSAQRFKRQAILRAGLVALVLAGAFSLSSWGIALENLSRDWRFVRRGTQVIQTPITVIEIDQTSLEASNLAEPLVFWGPHHARVFSILDNLGAKAIGFDLVQPLSPSDLEPDHAQAQAQVLAVTPIIVLSFTRSVLPNGQISEVRPNPQLETALKLGGGRLAFANMSSDRDGVVRALNLTDVDKSCALSLEVAAVATGQEPTIRPDLLQLGQKNLALESGRLILNYCGPDRTFPRISYRDLLKNPQKFRSQIQDSVCLIGVTSPHLMDYQATPFSLGRHDNIRNQMPSVEIQANAVHTLLTGQTVRRLPGFATWLLIGTAILLSAPCCWMRRVFLAMLSVAVLGAAWILVCLVAFSSYNWQLPLVPVLAALSINAFLLLCMRLSWESRQ